MSSSTGSTIARASSGSRPRISSVEPLISANSAVTFLRSPSVDAEASRSEATRMLGTCGAVADDDLVVVATDAGLSAAPHASQNFAPTRLSAPHEGQCSSIGAPQPPQKRALSRLSALHLEQRI